MYTDLILRSRESGVSKDGQHRDSRPSFETPRKNARLLRMRTEIHSQPLRSVRLLEVSGREAPS
jgi:hypothetical protein